MMTIIYVISLAAVWISLFVLWARGVRFTYGALCGFMFIGILPFMNTFVVMIFTFETIFNFKIWSKTVPPLRKQ